MHYYPLETVLDHNGMDLSITDLLPNHSRKQSEQSHIPTETSL